ncbi:MAG: winged helix-turn-helix transcriptional regulator [Proteobacteria bacterium]|nr:winged helix-turn-helix transcriptional regulator [Pseudomonadota bacterium]MCP4917120.1 winged helix-turn-helix transcriptional regulator [Pseudomonadota bacterium]
MQLTVCSLDLDQRVVRRGDATLRLTSTEAVLLRYLADRPGQDVSRDELLRQVWGYADGVASRTVDTTIRRLRATASPIAAGCSSSTNRSPST